MCQSGSDRLFAVDASDVDNASDIDTTRALESNGARIGAKNTCKLKQTAHEQTLLADERIPINESKAQENSVDEDEAKSKMVPISHGKGCVHK